MAVLGTAVVVGLLAGASARALMRLVAVAADEPTGFSWAGTLGICLVYAILCLPAVLLALLPWRPLRWLGALATSGLLLAAQTATAAGDLAFHRLGDDGQVSLLVLAISLFAALAVAVGPAASVLCRWSSRRLLRR